MRSGQHIGHVLRSSQHIGHVLRSGQHADITWKKDERNTFVEKDSKERTNPISKSFRSPSIQVHTARRARRPSAARSPIAHPPFSHPNIRHSPDRQLFARCPRARPRSRMHAAHTLFANTPARLTARPSARSSAGRPSACPTANRPQTARSPRPTVRRQTIRSSVRSFARPTVRRSRPAARSSDRPLANSTV